MKSWGRQLLILAFDAQRSKRKPLAPAGRSEDYARKGGKGAAGGMPRIRRPVLNAPMSATTQRDHVASLAKRDSRKALEQAQCIPDPWFRSQALACVARFAEDDPVKIASLAATAASKCDDEYKRTAVRAWEIAALAERKFVTEATSRLRDAVNQSRSVTPLASRAEALVLLLHAALRISDQDAERVAYELKNSCGQDSHWRCKRAIRDAVELTDGTLKPRPFFW